jgi:hypothetical protein
VSEPAAAADERARRLALDVDLVPEQTEDESATAWGDRPESEGAQLQHYLDEKPPHHL